MLREYGTPAIMERCLLVGDAPVRNWGGIATDFPEVQLIAPTPSGRTSRPWGCWRCPHCCGGHMKAGTGEYQYQAGAHKPEYETLAMFGSNCMNTTWHPS